MVWYLQDENKTWEDDIFDESSATKVFFFFFLKISKYIWLFISTLTLLLHDLHGLC
jgi:hypothetical protein